MTAFVAVQLLFNANKNGADRRSRSAAYCAALLSSFFNGAETTPGRSKASIAQFLPGHIALFAEKFALLGACFFTLGADGVEIKH